MALDPGLAGRAFPATPPYLVTEERIAEFAAATGDDREPGTAAPATFPIVVAFQAMTALMEDPSVGISLHNVVHGEQRFSYARPVVPGDTLTATLTVESMRQMAGADIIATRSEIQDVDGELVVTARAVLVHRGDQQ